MVTHAIISDLVVDLRALARCVPAPQYARPGSPAGAHQGEVAQEYLQRTKKPGRKQGTPEGAEMPMTKEVKLCGSRMPVPVVGAFAEVPSDVASSRQPSRRVTPNSFPPALWRRRACKSSASGRRGATGLLGLARLLLDRRRGLTAHGPRVTCKAGGEFVDEEQQWHDDHHCHCPGQFRARASD